jgi:polar amino acid transport system ATP-binding protein
VNALLQVYDLKKSYGKTLALDGVNINVSQGEILVVMGPSGCGKSTLIRCINRLTEPDSGEIFFKDQSVMDMSPQELLKFRRRVGFVFQHFNLVKRLTVKENVMFGLVLGGMDSEKAEEIAIDALRKVGLQESSASLPEELSGGQQQRVGIARALALNPEIMLLDEPTASLDPILVGEVLDVMEDLARNAQATMIIVTHEVSFAMKVAHRIILMDHGKIVEEGIPEEIFREPRSEIGRKYKRLLVA